jgi:PsbN protein
MQPTPALAPFPLPPTPMDPTSTSPALSVALAVLAVLLALTGFGIYTAFGPPSKRLTDPFDDHED